MMVTDFRCLWQNVGDNFHYVGDSLKCIKWVISIQKLSSTHLVSNICHQHIKTSVWVLLKINAKTAIEMSKLFEIQWLIRIWARASKLKSKNLYKNFSCGQLLPALVYQSQFRLGLRFRSIIRYRILLLCFRE